MADELPASIKKAVPRAEQTSVAIQGPGVDYNMGETTKKRSPYANPNPQLESHNDVIPLSGHAEPKAKAVEEGGHRVPPRAEQSSAAIVGPRVDYNVSEPEQKKSTYANPSKQNVSQVTLAHDKPLEQQVSELRVDRNAQSQAPDTKPEVRVDRNAQSSSSEFKADSIQRVAKTAQSHEVADPNVGGIRRSAASNQPSNSEVIPKSSSTSLAHHQSTEESSGYSKKGGPGGGAHQQSTAEVQTISKLGATTQKPAHHESHEEVTSSKRGAGSARIDHTKSSVDPLSGYPSDAPRETRKAEPAPFVPATQPGKNAHATSAPPQTVVPQKNVSHNQSSFALG